MQKGAYPNNMNPTDIARAFGVSRQAVCSWDCPFRKKPGSNARLYSLPEVIQNRLDKLRGDMEAQGQPSSRGEADAARRKRQAEASIKEAQLGEMLGLLVSGEDVKRQWERVLLVFRQQLEGLGATMAKRLENKTAGEIAEILNTRVDDLLAELVDNYAQGDSDEQEEDEA